MIKKYAIFLIGKINSGKMEKIQERKK